MVGLVNDDGVGQRGDIVELLLVVTAAEQVGVVEDFEVGEDAADVGQVAAERLLPHRLAGGLGHDEDNPLGGRG